jgi:hypothetical protein
MNRSLRIRLPVAVVLIIAVLVLVLALVLAGAGDDKLSIRQSTDGNVTVVTITGPKLLLDRVAEVAALRKRAAQIPSLGQSSCGPVSEAPGFRIWWGDEGPWTTYASPLPPGPDGCPDPLSHVYAVPGTYRIGAHTYHMGPVDGTVVDWHDGTSVSVDVTPPPLALSVVAPHRDKTHFFGEPVIVRWTLSTPERINLLVEIVGRDGAVLGKQSFRGLKYAAEGEARINLNQDGYAHHLLNETTPVIARVRVRELNRDLLVSESEPFYLTARIDDVQQNFAYPQVELLPNAPRTVGLRHHPGTVSCHVYGVDWGDGSPLEQHNVGCSQKQTAIETPHTYQQAGRYQIVLRTTNRNHEADLSLMNAPYQVLEITVP